MHVLQFTFVVASKLRFCAIVDFILFNISLFIIHDLYINYSAIKFNPAVRDNSILILDLILYLLFINKIVIKSIFHRFFPM